MSLCRPARERIPHLALVTAHPGLIGGMEKFARFLLETALTAGWRVTVALSGKSIFEEAGDRFGNRLAVDPVHWVDGTFRGDREYLPRRVLQRRQWFRQTCPDVAVFLQSFNTSFRASIVGAALAGIPIVVTHRTMPYPVRGVASRPHLFGLLPGLGLHRRQTVFRTWLTSALASRLVYNSTEVRQNYERQYRYESDKGLVIPNAVSLPAEANGGVHKSPTGPVTIGYVGRLHTAKGLDVLLRATALLRQRQPVRTLICGGGEQRAELAALADQLGLKGLVEWRGPVEDVWPVYQKCDIIALCSRQESSSNMVLEAMSMGKPVVVTRVGGLPELVQHGRAGAIVEPDDVDGLAEALQRLVSDRQERDGLGARAREAARRMHDPAVVGRAWLEVLDCAARSSRTRPRDVGAAMLPA